MLLLSTQIQEHDVYCVFKNRVYGEIVFFPSAITWDWVIETLTTKHESWLHEEMKHDAYSYNIALFVYFTSKKNCKTRLNILNEDSLLSYMCGMG